MRRILLCVGAVPGALKIPELARQLASEGHAITVSLEPRTRHFVGSAAFSGHALLDGEPDGPFDAAVFAPATSATLARLARGLAPEADLAVSTRRVFVAPDLDDATADHPAVAENLRLLRSDGVVVVEGEGGMASPGLIAARVLGSFGGPLGGRKVLVTAGGTHEPIDGVRFVGNRSSGKMGLAVAREALRMGAEVTVVAANVGLREPGVGWVAVETVEQMRDAVLGLAGGVDALVMAAAVSDFTPAAVAEGKIRRGDGGMTLELVGTPDILKAVREQNPKLFVVGFAATHGDPVADAREKLRKKGADLIVGNDVSRTDIGFGADENEVYVVSEDAQRFVARASKREVARAILRVVADRMVRTDLMKEERQS